MLKDKEFLALLGTLIHLHRRWESGEDVDLEHALAAALIISRGELDEEIMAAMEKLGLALLASDEQVEH